MSHSRLTCILCPNGCELEIEWTNSQGGPTAVNVAGNLCPKGIAYAIEEITAPLRTVTTTVRVRQGVRPLLSVRTAMPVPLSLVPDCLKEMRATVVTAPVEVGETVLANVAGTGVEVVATRSVPRTNHAPGA